MEAWNNLQMVEVKRRFEHHTERRQNKQRNEFVKLGGGVGENGYVEVERRR